MVGVGLVAVVPQKSMRGGRRNSITASSDVPGRALPARMKNGTPAQRHESISARKATKVSTVEPGATPGSSR